MNRCMPMALVITLATPLLGQEKGREKEWKETVEAARREGKVAVQGPTDRVVRNEIMTKFQARFGFPVEFVLGRSSEVMARIPRERQAGIYTLDVVMSGAGTMAPILYPMKVLDPLKPALMLPEVVDPSKWKKGKLWFADPEQRYVLRLINYIRPKLFVNTDTMKPEEFTSVKELLHPKWKGRITVRDPTDPSGGTTDAVELYYQLGDDFVRKFYLDQKPAVSRNARQMADWLARGTYPIAVGAPIDDVLRLRRDGFPLAIVYTLPDLRGFVTAGNGLVALMNKAPHPNAARVFVNWLASREGMEVLGRASVYPTTRNDVDESYAPPEMIPRPDSSYFDSSDWEYTLTGKEKARERVEALLGIKR